MPSRRCARSRRATTIRQAPAGRSTKAATASSSPRAPACWCSKSSTMLVAEAPRSSPSWPAMARPPTRTTSPCRRRAARAEPAPRGWRSARPACSRRDRPRQRSRHLDARGRPGRAGGLPDGLRRACPDGLDQRHQGRHRPHAWRGRRHQRRRGNLRHARWLRATHAQSRRSLARGRRARLHAGQGEVARGARRAGECLRLWRPELGARPAPLGRSVSNDRAAPR